MTVIAGKERTTTTTEKKKKLQKNDVINVNYVLLQLVDVIDYRYLGFRIAGPNHRNINNKNMKTVFVIKSKRKRIGFAF